MSMESRIFEVLNGKLDEQVERLRQVVCDGGAKSHDQYRELCGEIRGLQSAQREINDLVQKLTKDYEDG
jgi:hypothetical protein